MTRAVTLSSMGPPKRPLLSSSRFGSQEVVTVSKSTGEVLIERRVDVVFEFVVDERSEPLYNSGRQSS